MNFNNKYIITLLLINIKLLFNNKFEFVKFETRNSKLKLESETKLEIFEFSSFRVFGQALRLFEFLFYSSFWVFARRCAIRFFSSFQVFEFLICFFWLSLCFCVFARFSSVFAIFSSVFVRFAFVFVRFSYSSKN